MKGKHIKHNIFGMVTKGHVTLNIIKASTNVESIFGYNNKGSMSFTNVMLLTWVELFLNQSIYEISLPGHSLPPFVKSSF